MPEWEAYYFGKFCKNGYLVCISKTVKISGFVGIISSATF